jgi:hypothetical protein
MPPDSTQPLKPTARADRSGSAPSVSAPIRVKSQREWVVESLIRRPGTPRQERRA